jgi:gamma-glutamyltranspeptidase / glutathione hydrolase
MKLRAAGSILIVGALAACGAPPQAVVPAGPGITDATAQVAESARGMVSSAAVPATDVGARVLAQGGNAADAAVATGFALAVAEPAMSGIAGRAAIVVRTPDGEIHGLDGLNEVPAGFQEGGAEGYERAAVPGALSVLVRLLEEHGTWPLDQVMAPAIRLAEEGFVLTEAQARRLSSASDDLALHPGARAIFFREDGRTWEAGDRLVQADLASTLRAVAQEGSQVFYRGWIADSIHADMARSGGFITRDDLARYEARDAIPVRGEYRGLTVASNFRPASGHTVIQALQILDEAVGEGVAHLDEADFAVVIGQAMGLALADRNRRITSEEEDARLLTSREHARRHAAAIVMPGATERSHAPAAPAVGAKWTDADATTHFSVADENGMFIAVTQSLGPSLGTRVVTPGLGFLYATRLGSEPGSRPSSTISPTLVLQPDDTPLLALGGAGDARIISAVIQVVARRFGQGLSLADAMAAPRVHPTGTDGLTMEEGEGGWAPEHRARAGQVGLDVDTQGPGFFGRVHAVELTPAGILGVAEPRWEGSAAGPAVGDDGGPTAMRVSPPGAGVRPAAGRGWSNRRLPAPP